MESNEQRNLIPPPWISSCPMNPSLGEFISHYQARIEAKLAQLLDNIDSHNTTLVAAMKHSLLGGGKRMRPLLAYATAQALNNANDATDNFACALECIHVYSLIHDDLPAMDDDELRRGKPTCHIAYDEATAILAGDALQTLAFEVLADSNIPLPPQLRINAISELARASGARGMVVGQAIDLEAVDSAPSISQMETMHKHKTGALIEASVVLGALSANANEQSFTKLRSFAQTIGLAFQIQDDILDVTSDTKTLGKAQGADIKRNKPTYVSLLGLENAQEKVRDLYENAIDALAPFGEQGQMLRLLAQYIVKRNY